jgi:hypothetical protein
MRRILTLLAVFTIAGCASEAPAPASVTVASAAPAASGVPGKQVCHKESVVGTNFAQNVCYTQGGADDPNIAHVTDDLMRQMGTNQAIAGRAGKN